MVPGVHLPKLQSTVCIGQRGAFYNVRENGHRTKSHGPTQSHQGELSCLPTFMPGYQLPAHGLVGKRRDWGGMGTREVQSSLHQVRVQLCKTQGLKVATLELTLRARIIHFREPFSIISVMAEK